MMAGMATWGSSSNPIQIDTLPLDTDSVWWVDGDGEMVVGGGLKKHLSFVCNSHNKQNVNTFATSSVRTVEPS